MICTAQLKLIGAGITSLVLSGCAGIAIGASEPLDCSIPHTDTRIDKCAVVRLASEFGSCISNGELTDHACIIMDSDLSLCDASTNVSFTAMFDRSDKTLDCAGGSIEHKTSAARQLPMARFYDDRSLSNINIRNCTLTNTFHAAIQLTRLFHGQLGGDGIIGPGEALPVGHNNLQFENLKIESASTGIYIGTYSSDVRIDKVRINNTRRIAVYSEAGSNNINISNSIFSNNQTREAMALDSTYNSSVKDSLFINNRDGAINVYQNCGELKGTVCPVVRSTPPNNNEISGNSFINNGVTGVQIASRQGRNHSLGWCASLNGLPGKFTDTAINNTVENNTFVCNEGTSLVVMDGPNTIRDNRITARDRCIPYEISTGGHPGTKSDVLDGLQFLGNTVDSARPPKLRNIGTGVNISE